MSAFHDMVARDIQDVILNLDEFASMHFVEGAEIPCVLQDEELQALDPSVSLGNTGLTLYAATQDLPARRATGSALDVDGVIYTVSSWTERMGLSTVKLVTPL